MSNIPIVAESTETMNSVGNCAENVSIPTGILVIIVSIIIVTFIYEYVTFKLRERNKKI